MKLMCISILPQIYNQTNIEIGKVYETLHQSDYESYYKLISIILDNGSSQAYPKSCFVTLDEFRNNKINNILDDKD